jgi:DNA-directed RNA polymerase subunit RPC12/RpoP
MRVATLDMFPKPPRKKRRVMMHVIDAGDHGCVYEPGNTHIAQFQCAKCGDKSGWIEMRTATDGRRGIPCPNCN